MTFIGTATGIVATSLALAAASWTLISSDDGRLKALLWWAIGVTATVAVLLSQLFRRESAETRYGRALPNLHDAHHLLRDASYSRFIAGDQESAWHASVAASLKEFAAAFTIATGVPCHATIKRVLGSDSASGADSNSSASLEVKTLFRSAERSAVLRAGVKQNLVGNNTDFRHLFESEHDNRCWYHNDLLKLELYDNPHWPEKRTPSTVPYRSTMVWPVRKVLRPATGDSPVELFIYGFLTVDTPEADVLDYGRHFYLGAAYADHLLGVLWEPDTLRKVDARLRDHRG